MLKVEELTKEQLITEYNRLRTESEAEVTNLRGKVDSLRGKNDSLCGKVDSLHAKLEAHNSLVSNLDDVIERKEYEFTSSGILCTNHINCRDQLCVNLDTGELIPQGFADRMLSGRVHLDTDQIQGICGISGR